MKTSKRGINDIIQSEGLMLKAYQDTVGVWTIGVGHAATSGRPPIPHKGMVITRKEAEDILSSDLAFFETIVRKYLGDNLPQHVFDGATSFVLNTGGHTRDGKPASWFALYRQGKMAEAEKSFLSWRFPPEIMGRRKREADLIFRGKYFTPVVGSEPSVKPSEKPVQPVPTPTVPQVPEVKKTDLWSFLSRLFTSLFGKK